MIHFTAEVEVRVEVVLGEVVLDLLADEVLEVTHVFDLIGTGRCEAVGEGGDAVERGGWWRVRGLRVAV